MSACERCWGDAFIRAKLTGKSQVDCYMELLEERKGDPCSPEEGEGDDDTR